MAIVQNPLTGRSSGKFANAIFSKNYQKNIIRSKPIEVANPKTIAQELQRNRFKAAQAYVSMLLQLFRIGFYYGSDKSSAYARGVKIVLEQNPSAISNAFVVDPLLVPLSNSKVDFIQNVTAGIDSGNIVIAYDIPQELEDYYLEVGYWEEFFDWLNGTYRVIGVNAATKEVTILDNISAMSGTGFTITPPAGFLAAGPFYVMFIGCAPKRKKNFYTCTKTYITALITP
jgi:hypothetical protein